MDGRGSSEDCCLTIRTYNYGGVCVVCVRSVSASSTSARRVRRMEE